MPGVCGRVSLDDSWALRPVNDSQLLKRVRSICGVPTIVSLATYYSKIASEMYAPKGRRHQARIDQSVTRRPVIPTTTTRKRTAIASHDSRYIFDTYLPNRFLQRIYIDNYLRPQETPPRDLCKLFATRNASLYSRSCRKVYLSMDRLSLRSGPRAIYTESNIPLKPGLLPHLLCRERSRRLP